MNYTSSMKSTHGSLLHRRTKDVLSTDYCAALLWQLIVGAVIVTVGVGLSPQDVVGQYVPLDMSVHINSIEVEKFTEADLVIPPGYTLTRIATEYGRYSLERNKALESLEASNIYSVNLVQSLHSTIGKRDELLLRRLFALAAIMPRVVEAKDVIQWNVFDQSSARTQAEAMKLFHGYYVVHRPLHTPERAKAERKMIEDIVKGRVPLADSTVLRILTRRKGWDSTVIVCDVTGSMSPYTSQILRWVALQSRKDTLARKFVFFNDGDDKMDDEKTVGDAGGLYSCASMKLDSIYAVMTEAMTAGSGGDAPENDLEAVIHAQNEYPDAKGIILVCDNYATPRDLSLISQVKLPVHVIACGASDGYLDPTRLTIAYATKGTFHTMEEDIESLEKLRDGEEIRIRGKRYRLRDGDVVLIDR